MFYNTTVTVMNNLTVTDDAEDDTVSVQEENQEGSTAADVIDFDADDDNASSATS